MMSSYLFKNAYIGDRFVCWMLAAVFLVGTCAAAAPADFAPGLCMVPVKDGTKTWVDEVAAFDARTSAARPTSRYPVPVPLQLPEAILYRHNGGAWKISNDNVLMPFGGGFPNSWLWDHFIVESPSGRILGTGADKKSVFSFDPDSGLFALRCHSAKWAAWVNPIPVPLYQCNCACGTARPDIAWNRQRRVSATWRCSGAVARGDGPRCWTRCGNRRSSRARRCNACRLSQCQSPA